MLILTRKRGERICIGDGVEIVVLDCGGARVRLGIDAPKNVNILRGELCTRGRMSPSKDVGPSNVPQAKRA
jgi:carbon storage regulator